jgi:hypothetical protein
MMQLVEHGLLALVDRTSSSDRPSTSYDDTDADVVSRRAGEAALLELRYR